MFNMLKDYKKSPNESEKPDKEHFEKSFDEIQKALQCCGVKSPYDWDKEEKLVISKPNFRKSSVEVPFYSTIHTHSSDLISRLLLASNRKIPSSCMEELYVGELHHVGCFYRLKHRFVDSLRIFASAVVVMALIQILGVLMLCKMYSYQNLKILCQKEVI